MKIIFGNTITGIISGIDRTSGYTFYGTLTTDPNGLISYDAYFSTKPYKDAEGIFELGKIKGQYIPDSYVSSDLTFSSSGYYEVTLNNIKHANTFDDLSCQITQQQLSDLTDPKNNAGIFELNPNIWKLNSDYINVNIAYESLNEKCGLNKDILLQNFEAGSTNTYKTCVLQYTVKLFD